MSTNQPEDNAAGRPERTGPSDPAQDSERPALGSWITNRARRSREGSDDIDGGQGDPDGHGVEGRGQAPADQDRGDARDSNLAGGIGENSARNESGREGLHADHDRDRLSEGSNRHLTGDESHGSSPAAPGPVSTSPAAVPGTDNHGDAHTSAMDVQDSSEGQNSSDGHSETRAMPLTHTKDPNDDERDRDRHRDEDPRDQDRDHHPRGRRDAGGAPSNREALLRREKDQFGGMKFGSAFFGWLTATGLAVLLTALAAAIGSAIGASNNVSINEVASQASENPASVGIPAAITIGVILLLSYFAGGYVAGRMARFNGMKQGVAVWLWAIIIAIIMAILGLIFGDRFSSAIAGMNTFPEVDAGAFTTGGIIALLIALAIALIGAILGGLTGMRYHRKIDRATYDDDPELDREGR